MQSFDMFMQEEAFRIEGMIYSGTTLLFCSDFADIKDKKIYKIGQKSVDPVLPYLSAVLSSDKVTCSNFQKQNKNTMHKF